jgi:integrase
VNLSYDVKIRNIIAVKGVRRTTYKVPWVVAGRRHSRNFQTRALADSFRSRLVTAARSGEGFDPESGLPESMVDTTGPTWYAHACAYVAMKWPRASAKQRKSIAESLATVTPALAEDQDGRPDPALLNRALYGWAFNVRKREAGPPPEDVAEALAWVERTSLPIEELKNAVVMRRALDALALRQDGKPAAATTISRKRAVFSNALRYAVELDLLPENPLRKIQWTAPATAEQVDRRAVPNPETVRALLRVVKDEGRKDLVGFFACLYFAALRPSEALRLRDIDCELPDTSGAWGRIILTGASSRGGGDWTDDGEAYEHRGLKHRAAETVRIVPIPPELVAILRAHIAEFGTAPDGRLFRGRNDGTLSSQYVKVWRAARKRVLTPAQVESPLARRPYDLRHGGVSLWLNAGVPATDVAERAGHTVAVLLRVYAKCIDGQTDEINRRIERALGDPGEWAA